MGNHRRDAGFSLAALITFLTIASIFIAAAIPVYEVQAKRELEEELIFRGGEYTRAIQRYQRKFGVYPTSIDQLLSTNNLRFLRHQYKDPITGKDFRIITLNPDGSLNGSKLFQQNMNNQALFGNTSTGAQSGQGPFQSQSQTQQQPGGFGTGGGLGAGGGFGSSGSGSNASGFGGFAPAPNQQTQQPGQQGQTSNPQQQQMQTASPGFSNTLGSAGPRVGGGGIVGVASDSDKQSIKIYNNRQKYNEWEFIALQNQQGQVNPGMNPGMNPAGAQQSNNPFGNPSRTPPAPGASPFGGGMQTGSPFGTGQQAPQNPFGAGTMTPTQPIPSK